MKLAHDKDGATCNSLDDWNMRWLEHSIGHSLSLATGLLYPFNDT